MISIEDFCDQNAACGEGREWALAHCNDMKDAWHKLNTDWLLWVATRPGVLTNKELRLFAVFCARQVEHLLADNRRKNAINVAERFASGQATADELAAARDATRDADADAYDAAWDSSEDDGDASDAARNAACAAARYTVTTADFIAASAADWDADRQAARYAAAGAARAAARAAAYNADEDAYDAAAWNAAIASQAAWLRANTKPDFSR